MELVQKPIEPALLVLSRASVNDEGTKLKFVVDDFQYEYELASEKLVKLGKAPPLPPLTPPNGINSREEFERWREEQLRRQTDQRRDQNQDQDRNNQQQDNQQNDNVQQQENQQQDGQRESQNGGSSAAAAGQRGRPDHRNYSPDRKAYVFAKGHNLFYVELKDEPKDEPIKDEQTKEEAKTDEAKKDETKRDEAKQNEGKKDESKADDVKKSDSAPQDKSDDAKKEETKKADDTKPADIPAEQKPSAPATPVDHDGEAIQLTTDGEEDYSFASRFGGFGAGTT